MGEAKKKVGRPSVYTQELAEKFCQAFIAFDGGVHHLCEERDDFPMSRTIWRWNRSNEEFCRMFTQAREEQADRMAYSGVRLLQSVNLDEDSKINNAVVTHARNQADYILKLIPKIAPRTMGETQKHLLGGAEDAPPIKTESGVSLDVLSPEDQSALRALARKAHTSSKT